MSTKAEIPVQPDFLAEVQEWIEAFDEVVVGEGPEHGAELLDALRRRAREAGVTAASEITTPYLNTIPRHEEETYPGDRNLEQRVEALIRWNAMAMVHGQNKKDAGIGGHIATYSSLATLLEVGFNHFFRADYNGQPGDFVYFQGHASPGVYARAFLEGRLTEEHLKNFRHELRDTPGLSSYPHPWLMPDFWRFPTVSMGIGPLNALYQARFMHYLENRGLIEKTNRKIWAFVGDGETGEVDTLGALPIATREKLDNLIFVVNCNLQRLDGPVSGNKRIIDELEGVFRGAGWNVIKVVWGADWDKLFERDHQGLLLKRMEECVDGDYQAYKAKGGAYLRQHFFGKYPELLKLVEDYSDEQLANLHRGGHDPQKIYNAYKRAIEHTGSPTVILAKTVKGYGIGTTQARNASHQEKKLSDDGVTAFIKQFNIPIPEEQAAAGKPWKPEANAPEIEYLQARRAELGGYLPQRTVAPMNFKAPALDYYGEWTGGSKGREVSTTMGFVSILRHLLKDAEFGKYVVPIVPDEGRTFGLESAIRQVGIYAPEGQKYTPHDSDMLLSYREEKDGQILEEGITEAGSLASFTAAGTAYANYRVPAIPFYMYYSMFGFQRIGDMIWAFADSRGKGFLMGGTAGRTTMLGEGLQHQDGHSHVLSSTVPTCLSYDPAFVYELATIVQDGIKRMYQDNDQVFYYITMYNEDYAMPAMPEGSQEGILRGIYRFQAAPKGKATAQLFGSGPILNEVIKAQAILADKYGVQADVWSVTSYNELRRDALSVERWNRLHPAEPAKKPYILEALGNAKGPIIAASDYMKSIPDSLAPWLLDRLVTLGTDGFGRSDNREHLRRHFEVDAPSIVAATLSKLARDGKFDAKKAQAAFAELGIDTEKIDAAKA
ncbi:pyruvate dehydrogenase (acetyl-transferring), homodimeric type [Silvibacterium dinghuense]|uniref:Pyruvate dehydrogenase E1 component n=1 Tax=Silvibacterium dinghuense TaxID=1560006 RepID=A0A4Q1SI44_9BACT|nr:pyruvate dehydrogenase (acetyl-transferring), homodimeric type [Silvibacterium dinghuense]RXS97281.1 pyruvate dehydrogenase (acetyl-transferring), homodimeric type [Silvibacterium dinghuense]GGG97766.1 pyruvate dehydrogenase E1 component [Silvibacterium dinghuense]